MKPYVCLYAVEYYDGSETHKTEYGLVYANDFADAMHQLEHDLYGNDLMKVTHMELFESSAVFSKEVFDRLRTELEEGV